MEILRKSFQGVWNIIRFNWHFYVIAFVFVLGLFFSKSFLHPSFHLPVSLIIVATLVTVLTSLVVSYYVYDYSNLYDFPFLKNITIPSSAKLLNINAGFDETSSLLNNKYANAQLQVLDFYNPQKHTEVSIKRARTAYPPYPNTQSVETNNIPFESESIDLVFALLSAHEIRDKEERVLFFKELNRVLKKEGQIIITEHLRDTANFFAYTIGFFHFHSKLSWQTTFQQSGLAIIKEIKTTPFITTFILKKHGNSS